MGTVKDTFLYFNVNLFESCTYSLYYLECLERWIISKFRGVKSGDQALTLIINHDDRQGSLLFFI